MSGKAVAQAYHVGSLEEGARPKPRIQLLCRDAQCSGDRWNRLSLPGPHHFSRKPSGIQGTLEWVQGTITKVTCRKLS
jgi:hypothetical protein